MRKRMLAMISGGVAAAAAVAAVGTLQLWFWAFPFSPTVTPLGAVLPGLFALPGFAAGFVWVLGSRTTPRIWPATLATVLLGILMLVVWAAVWAGSPRWIPGALLYLPPRLRLYKALLMITIVAASACGLWLGTLAGRRVPDNASRILVAGVAALSIAMLGFVGWIWPLQLFPDRAIDRVVRDYILARVNGRYDDAVVCFTPDYLRRVFGAPPYGPKFRQALATQLGDLRATEREWCGAIASIVRPMPGTRDRCVTIWYHYHGEAPQIHIGWYYDMTFCLWGRRWRIADMRLDRKRSEELFKGLRLGEGPCGTGRILRLPPDLQA
jgi:hypothetical protein